MIAGLVFFLLLIFLFKKDINNWFSDNTKLFPQYFHLLPLLLIYDGLFTYFENYLRIHLRTSFPTFLRNVVLRIFWTIQITLVYYKMIDFNEFINWYVHALGITLMALIAYALPKFIQEFSLKFMSKKEFSPLLRFALYAIMGAGSGYLANYIDVIMVGGMIDLKSAAVYSVAFYISSVISVPLNAVNKITTPIVSQLWKENNIEKLNNLYKQTSNSMLLISLWIFLGIWANIDNMFEILPPEYKEGKWVILFIALAKLYDASFGINAQIIQFSEKFKWMLYFNITMAVIVLITNLLLIPVLGVTGAAFATFLSVITLNTARLIFLNRQFQLFPFCLNDLKILISGVFILTMQYLIPKLPLLTDIIVRSLVITIIYFSLNVYLKTSPELNKFIRKHLKFN
jgi:O-antigen/teichoic acid export membrane protein